MTPNSSELQQLPILIPSRYDFHVRHIINLIVWLMFSAHVSFVFKAILLSFYGLLEHGTNFWQPLGFVQILMIKDVGWLIGWYTCTWELTRGYQGGGSH